MNKSALLYMTGKYIHPSVIPSVHLETRFMFTINFEFDFHTTSAGGCLRNSGRGKTFVYRRLVLSFSTSHWLKCNLHYGLVYDTLYLSGPGFKSRPIRRAFSCYVFSTKQILGYQWSYITVLKYYKAAGQRSALQCCSCFKYSQTRL
jgi:hypothetical protein